MRYFIVISATPIQTNTLFLQANTTFSLVGRVSDYARLWLNISRDIRHFLHQNLTRRHLEAIADIQKELLQLPQQHPLMESLSNYSVQSDENPFIESLSNYSVPDAEDLLRELDKVRDLC